MTQIVSKFFDELSNKELYEILCARNAVFLMEQRIVCMDTDGVDYRALHCFIEQNGKIIAYLRAFYDDKQPDTVMIGRVLTTVRSKGYGRALMESAMREIRQKLPCARMALHAQCHAAGFYEKFGFQEASAPFLEEGVAHILMNLVV